MIQWGCFYHSRHVEFRRSLVYLKQQQTHGSDNSYLTKQTNCMQTANIPLRCVHYFCRCLWVSFYILMSFISSITEYTSQNHSLSISVTTVVFVRRCLRLSEVKTDYFPPPLSTLLLLMHAIATFSVLSELLVLNDEVKSYKFLPSM